MRVVHLSTTDMGGAYEAAQRISDCLTTEGMDSEVIVRTKFRENTLTIPFYNTIPQKFVSKIKNFFNLILSNGDVVIDKYGADICKHPHVQSADIICLHWVNSFVSNSEVKKILDLGKPVFWIMHDMWPFTGGCHYAGDCVNYVNECTQCPMVCKHKTEKVHYWHNRKKECFGAENLFPIGPSRWISDCAKKSKIFQNQEITTISNPINVDIFYPKNILEKKEIREKYGLSEKKSTILFAAAKVTNPIKGFSYFVDAVKKLSADQFQILVLGENVQGDILKQSVDLEVVYTGFVKNSKQLCNIYNAADLLVAPSLQENYSNTVLESLACGIPAVVFDVGGMKDLVETGKNGYLAKLKDIDDLANGIVKVSNNKEMLGQMAREKVLMQNDYSVIAHKYRVLFQQKLLKEEKYE